MPPLRQTVWPAVAVSKAFCKVFQGSARVPGFSSDPEGEIKKVQDTLDEESLGLPAATVDIAFLWLSTTPTATAKIKMSAEDRELETNAPLKAQAPLLRQMLTGL